MKDLAGKSKKGAGPVMDLCEGTCRAMKRCLLLDWHRTFWGRYELGPPENCGN